MVGISPSREELVQTLTKWPPKIIWKTMAIPIALLNSNIMLSHEIVCVIKLREWENSISYFRKMPNNWCQAFMNNKIFRYGLSLNQLSRCVSASRNDPCSARHSTNYSVQWLIVITLHFPTNHCHRQCHCWCWLLGCCLAFCCYLLARMLASP